MSLSLVESIMDSMDRVLPKCNPLYLLISVSCAPILLFSFIICIRTFASYSDNRQGREIFSRRFLHFFFHILKRYSWLIFLLNLILWVIVAAIQSLYVYNTMQVGTDVTYYLTVDLPVFDANSAINTAMTTYSFNIITTQAYIQDPLRLPTITTTARRAWEKNENKKQRKQFLSQSFQKQLKSSTSTISIVYHDDNYDNLVTNNNLIDACLTERNILHNVDCLLTTNYESILAASFNASSCGYLTSFSEVAPNFALSDNNYFVQDNPGSPSSPDSAIIISYFEVGSCDQISLDDLGNLLNEQGVNGISMVYVNSQMVSQAFYDSIFNSITLSIYALILCSIFFIFCVRGFIVPLVTLLTMVIATANAAALLPLWGYGYFSAFNIMSLFILLGVGVNSVILFGSAWRKHVLPGTKATVPMLQEAYHEVALATLFTTVAATLSLFSKLASPVIVISQLGAFMGVAVLVFYVLLHYLIVPMWLFTGYFRLPENIHRAIDKCQDQICGCVVIGYRTAPSPADDDDGENSSDEDRNSDDDSVVHEQAAASAPTWNSLPNQDNVVKDKALPIAEYPYARIVTNPTTEEEKKHDDVVPIVAVFSSTKLLKGEEVVYPHYYRDDRIDLENPPLSAPSSHAAPESSNGNNQGLFHHSHSDDSNSHAHAANNDDNNNARQISVNSSHHGHRHDNDGHIMQCLKYIWRIKRRTWLGIFALLLTLLALGGVYELVMRQLNVDFGIPQLFSPSSNLGQALYIVKNYKSSLLSGDSLSDIHVGSYTYSPTKSPALAPPQSAPTFAPVSTPVPTIGSESPSMLPSMNNPSPSPTYVPTTNSPSNRPNSIRSTAPTMMPTVTATSSQPSSLPSSEPSTIAPTTTPSTPSTDYTVTGCWGISTSKQYKDSLVDLTFDTTAFSHYMSSGGLVSDMMDLCDYVDSNKEYLNVNPSWNATTDCIYQQFIQASQSLFIRSLPPSEQTVSNTLLYWASQSITSGGLLGVQKNTTAEPLPGFLYALDITWLCANFSVESAVSNMVNNPNLAVTLNSRWQDAFAVQASTQANVYGVVTIAGSDEFTFPLLALEVLLSIILAVIITVTGFIGLLTVFTKGDIAVTLFGLYAMLFILAVAFCIHLYVFSHTVDLLDIVVLIAVVGMVVDFPIHYLMTYLRAKRNNEAEEGDQEKNGHVEQYITFALIAPMLFTVLSGVPLLFADLQLVTKCGQYIIIIAATSFVTTVLILPRMVKLNCCCSIWSVNENEVQRRRFSSMLSEDTEISQPLIQ